MLYRSVGASLTMTCLPLDLILRSLNMFHGDLTIGHSLLMLFSSHELKTLSFLCLPTLQPPFYLSTKDRTGSVNRNPHSVNVDNTALVYASLEPSDRHPVSTSPDGQSSVPAPQQCNSSSQQTVAIINGLQSIRESFQQRAISSKATNIILQSWSTGTQKQYAPYQEMACVLL